MTLYSPWMSNQNPCPGAASCPLPLSVPALGYFGSTEIGSLFFFFSLQGSQSAGEGHRGLVIKSFTSTMLLDD